MHDHPQNTEQLDDWLSEPTDAVRESLARLKGDILILGAGGKMGPTLARMARRALPEQYEVIAASRFRSAEAADQLCRHGVQVEYCDLLDRDQVARLPDVSHVIYMAGQKFGTVDAAERLWMMNAVMPSIVAKRYRNSRNVVFSTGCVYSFVDVNSGGSKESDPLDPPGEYANSCIARERVFSFYSQEYETPVLLFRLNYAIDLRYGVLRDIADKVWHEQPVDVTMGHVNVIWQGDANARALQCLEKTAAPPSILNVTGPECLSVRSLAERLGELMGKTPIITGEEAPTAWLSDASQSIEWFGPPTVSVDQMLEATADWVTKGGESLGKPTHFETRDGKY
ncbi:MAG: NAD(P)-dependent oxidoreductase [Planctomycetaceae bacterium]|nr:NAD(P)-dependent oxidoreductase [Planctomycetaceae bacterium]